MVILYILISAQTWGLDAVGTAIEQAQALALKKNRQEACAILKRTLDETPASSKSRPKLIDSLQHISKMFFTDKGQKIFEAGQAAMWDTPDISLAQFREALALEDQNVQILTNVARIQLMKQDCQGAQQSLTSARKLNPLFSEAALLELRALVCQQQFNAVREKAKALPQLNKWEESYLQYLLAQDHLQQKAWRKTTDAMLKLSEEEPQFPESYYLLSQAGGELNRDTEPWLQKYVSLCKGLTAREKKRFSLEPKLCAFTKEAEDELAKRKTTEL